MPSWEYAIEPIYAQRKDAADKLNAMGRDGWEAIAIGPSNTILFKREYTPAPPVNDTAPAITPATAPNVGDTLNCSEGTWSGTPGTIAYQWLADDTDVAGATEATYAIPQAQAGKVLACRVTSTNKDGTVSASSNTLPNVLPLNLVAPVITGDNPPISGESNLSCDEGTWAGGVTYTGQWQRGTTDIADATSNTYTPVAADEGQQLRCRVVAHNPGGNNQAFSSPTAAVEAPPAPPE
jgi:hypothetical protein